MGTGRVSRRLGQQTMGTVFATRAMLARMLSGEVIVPTATKVSSVLTDSICCLVLTHRGSSVKGTGEPSYHGSSFPSSSSLTQLICSLCTGGGTCSGCHLCIYASVLPENSGLRLCV